MIVNIHRVDVDNLGDQASSPIRYFDLGHCDEVDIGAFAWPSSDVYIVGGGGMLHGEQWPLKLQALTLSNAKVIFWGIGDNRHGATSPQCPDWMTLATLAGIRDYGTKHSYVPCASCMHPAFDWCRCVVPNYKYLIYEHYEYPIPIRGVFRVNNRQPFEAFTDIISFLAHGETIISNSFHGLYWAMLLNRKAVCVMPISSRFYGFKYAPVYATVDNWRESADQGTTHPDYLTECRQANIAFYEQVKGIIK